MAPCPDQYAAPAAASGLVILDTPGLNAVGAEPELTVNLIPQAHAVVFVLGADTGVTKSDLAIWRDHAACGRGQARRGRGFDGFAAGGPQQDRHLVGQPELGGAGAGPAASSAAGFSPSVGPARTECCQCPHRRGWLPRLARTMPCCRPVACRLSRICWPTASWGDASRCCRPPCRPM